MKRTPKRLLVASAGLALVTMTAVSASSCGNLMPPTPCAGEYERDQYGVCQRKCEAGQVRNDEGVCGPIVTDGGTP